MEREIILFTRAQKIKELTYLGKLIYFFKKTEPTDKDFTTDLVLPEAVILKVT